MAQRNAEPGDNAGDPTGRREAAGFPDSTEPRTGNVDETSMLPVVPDETEADSDAAAEPAAERSPRRGRPRSPGATGSFAGTTWVAMIVGLVILIVLIVFIMQNQQQIELNLFAWSFQFPAGIGYLITAIAGGLIVAMVGMVRIIELHRQVRKLRRHAG